MAEDDRDLKNQEESPFRPDWEPHDAESSELGSHTPSLRERASDEAKGRAKDELAKQGKKAAKQALKSGGSPTSGAAGAGEAAGGAAGGAAGTGAAGGAAGAAGTGAAGGAAAGTAGGATAGAAGGAAATGAGAAAAGGAAGASTAGVATGAAVGAGAASAGPTAGIGAVVTGVVIAAGFLVKYRRQVAVGVVIASLGGIVAFVYMLNVLKPIASTFRLAEKYLAPLEEIVDNRTVKLLSGFVVGGSKAAFAAHTQGDKLAATNPQQLAAADTTLAKSGKLKELYDAMKADGIEERLQKQFGIELRPTSGAVQIVVEGKVVGTARNAQEAENILRDRRLMGVNTLRRVLDAEARGWKWAQHIKFARNLKPYYDIPRLDVPDAKEAESGEEVADIVKGQSTTVLTPAMKNLNNALSCFTQGTTCSEEVTAAEPKAKAEIQADTDASIEAATQQALTANQEKITPENDYTTDTLNKTTADTIKEKLDKQASPILGWIDIVTGVIKAVGDKDYDKVPSVLRENNSGAMWTWWLSATHQMVAGDFSDASTNIVARNFTRMEESQAYHYLSYDDSSRGRGLETYEKINQVMPSAMRTFFETFVAANPIFQAVVVPAANTWGIVRDAFPIDFLLGIARTSPLFSFVERFMSNVLADQLGGFIDHTLGMTGNLMLPICDPASKEYNFFNCMAAGADASSNRVCKEEFGCGEVTAEQMAAIHAANEQTQRTKLAAAPLHDRLFSTTYPRSLVSTAALHLPIRAGAMQNVSSFSSNLIGAVWQMPSKAASIMSKPAHAIDIEGIKMNGVRLYAIPVEKLASTNIPLDVLGKDGGVCPEDEPGNEDICKSYATTTDILIARYKHQLPDDSAAGDAISGGDCGGAELMGKPVDYSNLLGKMQAGTVHQNAPQMLCTPAGFKVRMLKGPAAVSFLSMNAEFKKAFGKNMPVGGIYRTKEAQLSGGGTFANYDPNYPPPAHLWGTAIDFDTGVFKPGNPQHTWTVKNGPKFGWFWPNWAQNGGGGKAGVNEPWHFNYYFIGHNPNNDRLEKLK